MKISRNIVLAFIVMMFAACAENELAPSLSNATYEQLAVKQWMEKYGPANAVAVDGYNGMYQISVPSNNPTGKKPMEGNWVKVRYNIRMFGAEGDGNYVGTRYNTVAEQLGWWLNTTDYISDYVQFGNYKNNLTAGQQKVLEGMKEGDSVRLYLTSNFAYGPYGYSPTASHGFGGGSIGANTPVIIDMKLEEVIIDPTAYEVKNVDAYALNKMGLAPNKADTIGFYYIIDSTQTIGDKTVITEDSTVQINYTGWFLNGFMLDTNIDAVAKQYGRTASNGGKPSDFMPTRNGWIEAFDRIVLKMRRGEKARFVFTSNFGYKVEGKAGSPYIQPYTPLYYEIEILSKEKK